MAIKKTDNEIDKKKKAKQGPLNQDLSTKLSMFAIQILYIVLYIFLYVSFGGIFLYLSKLAQSNILPDEYDCAPYESSDPRIEKININIFCDGDKSKKIRFENDTINRKNKILDGLFETKNKNNTSFMLNFFMSVIQDLLWFNYWWNNNVFNFLNSYLNETAIVLLGPLLLPILGFIMFWLNIGHFYFGAWIPNMFDWFFKTNKNAGNSSGSPEWVKSTGNISFMISVILVSIFIFIGIGLTYAYSALGIIVNTICFFSMLSYKGTMQNETTSKWESVSVTDIVKDVFKYFKVTIMVVFSIMVTWTAFTTLGTYSGVLSCVLLLLILFHAISNNMFQQIKPEKLSANTSYDQANKWCGAMKDAEKKTREGWISALTQSGGGGKNIIGGLKKIAQRL
jgi:hypothetical protein